MRPPRTKNLIKKSLPKANYLIRSPLRGPAVGGSGRGLGGHKRPLIWGVYAGNAVREHGGVCEANGFPDDEGPYGRSLGAPL